MEKHTCVRVSVLTLYFNQNDVLWGLYIEVMCQLKNWQVTPVTYRSFVSAWWFLYEIRIWPFFSFTRKNLKWLMKKLVVWGDFIHQDWLLGSLFHWVQMHFVISKSLRNGLIPFLITLCTFFSTVFWKLFSLNIHMLKWNSSLYHFPILTDCFQ